MTLTSTRKQFFAKLLGAAAAVNVFPKLFAKSPSDNASAPVATVKQVCFAVRADARFLARLADAV